MPRWYEEAVAAVGGESQVIDSDGNDDYQGWGCILATGNRVLSWSYGSCGGCDPYEDYEYGAIVRMLRDDIEEFDTEEAARAAYAERCSREW